MIIVVQKDSAKISTIFGAQALQFYRAFRAELWQHGVQRDPKTGDTILGVCILSLTA